jgi:hypothetical protein
VAGSTTHSSGVYTVKGGGSDIWGTQDQFQYASQSVTGDQTITARLTSQTSTGTIDGWAKAGVMFRDSTAKGSKFVMIVATASNSVNLQWRSETDGNCGFTQATPAVAAPTSTNPVWVKLVKSGTNYKAYYATGTATPSTWTQVGDAAGITVSFGNTTYLAGLAVTAHNNAQLATSTMDNVSIVAPGLQSGSIYELEPKNAAGSRLHVTGSGSANGTGVEISTDTNSTNQRWKIEDQGSGVYELTPQHATGQRLDVSGSGTADGTKVQVWVDNNTNAQRWKFELQTDGSYEVIPQHDTSKRLKVNGGGTANGTAVQSWADDNSNAVRWNLLKQ